MSSNTFSDVSKSSVPLSGRWMTSDLATRSSPSMFERTRNVSDRERRANGLAVHQWENPTIRSSGRIYDRKRDAPTEEILSAMRIVVAVGGNALIKAGEAGTWPEQLENVREIAEAVLALRAQGHEVVLTHGNG